MDPEKKLCPSSKCKQGSQLLGIRQNGSITILPHTLEIDQNFIDIANQNGPPEKNFRFANKCVEGGCKQWTGSKCGVIDRMIEHLDKVTVSDMLPECSIRLNCRWHSQSGINACKICPYVITEISQDEIDAFFFEESIIK